MNGPKEWVIGIEIDVHTGNDGQIKSEDKRRQFSDPRTSPFHANHFAASNGNLVTFLVGITAIGVGKVDMAAGLRHHATDGIAPFANDVRMVSVGDVHFDGDAPGLGVQMIHDQVFGQKDVFLLASDANVRILLGLGANFQS